MSATIHLSSVNIEDDGHAFEELMEARCIIDCWTEAKTGKASEVRQ